METLFSYSFQNEWFWGLLVCLFGFFFSVLLFLFLFCSLLRVPYIITLSYRAPPISTFLHLDPCPWSPFSLLSSLLLQPFHIFTYYLHMDNCPIHFPDTNFLKDALQHFQHASGCLCSLIHTRGETTKR